MSELPELSGPIHEPASGGQAQQLVILCHGVGADGSDLIGLAPYLAKVLPEAKFIAPNAPYAFDGAPFGYQWFSLGDMSIETKLAGTQDAAPILAFLACGSPPSATTGLHYRLFRYVDRTGTASR